MRAIILILVMGLVLTACSNQSGPSDLYTGTQGVTMRIENGPSLNTLYFDKSDVTDTANKYDILIRTENAGSSYTVGRVFVSGFDRSLLYFRTEKFPDYDVGRQNCGVAVRGGENNRFLSGVSIGCALGGILDFFFTTDRNDAPAGHVDLKIGEWLANDKGWDWARGIVIGADWADGQYSFGIDNSLLPEDGSHGRLMSAYALAWLGRNPTTSSRWLETDKFYAMEGRTFFHPTGGIQEIDFPVEILRNNWPSDLPETQQQLLFTNCYAYATYATPLVCIDTQPYSVTRKACTAGSVTLGSQGAPVQVSRIDEEVTPKMVYFTIHVKHVGTGQIYKLTSLDKCDPWSYARVTESDLNAVTLGTVIFSGASYEDRSIECIPKNREIRLTNGEGSITCAYTFPRDASVSQTAYQAPLLVELWYGYGETIQKTVTIKRIG
ncbi:MAG: hypothetical protein ABIA93_04660 [Candidatus Woesearchaeota archaeon]